MNEIFSNIPYGIGVIDTKKKPYAGNEFFCKLTEVEDLDQYTENLKSFHREDSELQNNQTLFDDISNFDSILLKTKLTAESEFRGMGINNEYFRTHEEVVRE